MTKIFELFLPLVTKLMGKWLDEYTNQSDLEKLAKQKYLNYIKDIEPSLSMAVEVYDSANRQYDELKEQWKEEDENKKPTTHIIIP